MGNTTEGYIADGLEYFGTAYLPQLAFQSIENALARGDLQKAIQGKCGAAGASNAADLEKQLLQSNPMSPSRFFRAPTSDMGAIRLPWRQIPIFWGPRNPFLLTWSAAHELGSHLDEKERAMEIQDPVARQKALDAIGNGKLYWTGGLTAGALFLADSNRGFGLLSRMPGLNRWSALGSNSPYQMLLKDVSGKIQCNGQEPPQGGTPDAQADASQLAADPAAAAAPADGAVDAQDAVTDPNLAPIPAPDGSQMSMDPDLSAASIQHQACGVDEMVSRMPALPEGLVAIDGTSLASASLQMYQQGNTGFPASLQMQRGAQLYQGAATVVAPLSAPLTAPPISLPTLNFRPTFRPVVVAP